MTIREAKKQIKDRLSSVIGVSEAEAAAKLIIEEVKGYSTVELLMYADRELLPETIERIDKITRNIVHGQPVQYALGSAWFHGRKFVVNPSVLIPRPETSQLMDMIIDRWGKLADLAVLDIGTGSGCIAVTLALDLPFSCVKAVDISEEAIAVAKENAALQRVKVDFVHADAFDLSSCKEIGNQSYSIIVSNPPYVLESERESINLRVKNHEPELALFVPDEKKTALYSAISGFAFTHLNQGGTLYLEINPLCASEILDNLKNTGFNKAEIVLDYKGTKRFAIAYK